MNFKLFSLYPEMFPGSLGFSIAKKALEKKLWSYEVVNIRDYADNKHNNVDDEPFGGGTGMVLRPDVLGSAIEDNFKDKSKIIYMSPRGSLLDQNKVHELTQISNISIICGRYEGVDERVLEEYNIEEISVGDYILSGGEPAAIVLMDCCIRTLPGVISKKEALIEESFGRNEDYTGLLEYPLYTRPSKWKNRLVPEVLISGNHAKIKNWRKEQAIEITKSRRMDLYNKFLEDNTHN